LLNYLAVYFFLIILICYIGFVPCRVNRAMLIIRFVIITLAECAEEEKTTNFKPPSLAGRNNSSGISRME